MPNRAAYAIFLAQLVSVAGDRMFTIALSWWVVSQESLSDREWTLGLLLAASTLPAAVSGPLLGPVVDRLNRRTCMMIADAGRLGLMLGLLMLLQFGDLTVVALFAICIPLFALEPLFESAVSASLSALAGDAAVLQRLIAVESAMPNVGAVAGALLAGIALGQWDITGAFWFNAFSFLVSLALVSTLPKLKPLRDSGNAPSFGYGFLRYYPAALRLLALFALINFFEAPVFLYLPLLTRTVLNGDGATLSLLEMAFALGNLSIFAYFSLRPKVISRARVLRFLLVALSALCLGSLGVFKDTWALMIALLVGGASVAFVSFLAISSFQRSIPDDCKGRFFALLNSLCSISLPLSFAVFGALSSHLPLQELIFLNALCALLVSVGFLGIGDKPPVTMPVS